MLRTGGISELLITCIIFGSVGYYLYLSKKKKPMEMRPFPALQALDDAVDRCLEMGRPLIYVFGTLASITGEFAASVVASFNMLRYLAKRCFEKGVRLVTVPGQAGEIVPIVDSILKETSMAVGKTDSYKTDRDLMFFGGSYIAALCALTELSKPGCYTNIGVIGGPDMAAWEVAIRNNSLVIGGTHRLVQCGCFAVAADYALICDEMYAACAAASGNADLIATALSGDPVKLFSLLLIIVGVVLSLVGINILPMFRI